MTQAQSEAARSFQPTQYQQNAHFVPALGNVILDWLAVEAGERILDLGAGDGVLTERVVELGAEVVALDASPEMVKDAVSRGLDARLGDGQKLQFEREFDAVFSNAALHWMTDPDAVARGVFRALKPGGRFVSESGGFGCVAAVRLALKLACTEVGGDCSEPWYFPTAEAHRAVLERAGFSVDEIVVVGRPVQLPSGFSGWLNTFAKAQLSDIPAELHAQVIARTTELLRTVLQDESGHDVADYTRLRFRAHKPN